MKAAVYYAAIVWIFLLPWEALALIPGIGTASKLAGILTAALWVTSLLKDCAIRRPRFFHLTAICFIAWHAASLLWSIAPDSTLERLWDYAQNLVLVLVVWDVLASEDRFDTALQAYVFGCLVCVGGTIQSVTLSQGGRFVGSRFTAGDMNPNDLGLTVAMGIPLAAYLASSSENGGWLRALNYAYVPLAAITILLSGSRGSLLAAIPPLLFVLFTSGRLSRGRRLTLGLALCASIGVAVAFMPERLWQRFDETGQQIEGEDLTGRVGIWRQGIEVFEDNWVLGVGGGAYPSSIDLGRAAHNTWLSIMAELGVIGLAAFTCMLVACGYQIKLQPQRRALMWTATLGAWLIGILAHNWEQRELTWLMMGLAVAGAGLTTHFGLSSPAARTDGFGRVVSRGI